MFNSLSWLHALYERRKNRLCFLEKAQQKDLSKKPLIVLYSGAEAADSVG